MCNCSTLQLCICALSQLLLSVTKTLPSRSKNWSCSSLRPFYLGRLQKSRTIRVFVPLCPHRKTPKQTRPDVPPVKKEKKMAILLSCRLLRNFLKPGIPHPMQYGSGFEEFLDLMGSALHNGYSGSLLYFEYNIVARELDATPGAHCSTAMSTPLACHSDLYASHIVTTNC